MPPPQRCPWCSAELPDAGAATCPSCSANLTTDGEPQVPGVTAVDIERIALRRSGPPKKSRLMSWISGDVADDRAPEPNAAPGSLAPPPLEVRREMLRLEMDARIADLTAEAGAIAADEALETGGRLDPAGPAVEPDAPAPAGGLDPTFDADAGSSEEAPAAGDAAVDGEPSES